MMAGLRLYYYRVNGIPTKDSGIRITTKRITKAEAFGNNLPFFKATSVRILVKHLLYQHHNNRKTHCLEMPKIKKIWSLGDFRFSGISRRFVAFNKRVFWEILIQPFILAYAYVNEEGIVEIEIVK